MAHPLDRKISCKRCQTRKIKCSRTAPCTKCLSAGVRCEYRDFDSKRSPISREYVATLENRVASLEALLADKFEEPARERRAATSISCKSERLGYINKRSVVSVQGLVAQPSSSSLRSSELLRTYHRGLPNFHISTESSFSTDVRENPTLHEAIDSFIRWHNPLLMFFDELPYSRLHESPALAYSVAAMGAQSSERSEVRDKATEFWKMAERDLAICNLRLDEGSVEACLLCSMYHAGQGNTTKAQLYYDLAKGTARELTVLENDTHPNPLDDPRGTPGAGLPHRRMLLNLHKSDKILGLFLGRAAHTADNEGDLCSTELESSMLQPNNPMELKHLELFSLVSDILNVTSPAQPSPSSTVLSVTQLNAKLCAWQNDLPVELRWNRWGSSLEVIDPKVASLHMLYHTARLSLNQYLQLHGDSRNVLEQSTSLEICSSSIDLVVSILQRYKAQYNLRTSSIIFVHGAITACANILSIARKQSLFSSTDESHMGILDATLEELSCTWVIAKQARQGLHELLEEFHASASQVDDAWQVAESVSGSSDSLGTPYDRLEWTDPTTLDEVVGGSCSLPFTQSEFLSFQDGYPFGQDGEWLSDFASTAIPHFSIPGREAWRQLDDF